GPLPVEAQHRNTPLVLKSRIDLAVGVLVGDHLAASVEPDERAVVATHVLLDLHPVAAAGEPFHGGSRAVARHAPPAAELDVIAAREAELAGELLLVEPPRYVARMTVGAVLVERRQALQERHLSDHRAADRVHEVAPDLAARVAEPLGKLRALGVEQDAHRLAGARGEDHDACPRAPLLAGDAV